MDRYTTMTEYELRRLAYDMTEGGQAAASAVAELRRRARRDSSIDRADYEEEHNLLPRD